jgi:C4-dicarboxylate transporter DctM subunit
MIVALVLVLLLALGVPLFVVIGTAAALAFSLYLGHGGIDGLQVLIVKMTSLTTKNVFLAIPFFVVSGAIMSAGSIARRLVAVAEALVGGMRGGLAVAALLASVIFAALSGSSPVTLIAIGSILFPAMLKAGYREPFALGLVTTAGSLGCLVPPSIPMLVYAISVTGTSAVDVRELFLAGMGAALVITLMLAIYAVVRAGLEGPIEEPDDSKRPRTRFLPDNIYDGIRLFKGSRFAAELLGDEVHAKFAELKQVQADRCPRALGARVKSSEIQFHHEVTNQYLWSQF